MNINKQFLEQLNQIKHQNIFELDDPDCNEVTQNRDEAKVVKHVIQLLLRMDLVLETSKGPKTCITLEVKPYDTLIDLDALASEIFIKIKPEGLTWKKEYKVMPIAFGLKKIVLACIIEDEKVIVDDVMDKIADLGEISVDFSSFTKI